MNLQDLIAYLRDQIISELHRGRLHTGARLQSIRRIAEETGTDHRMVAEAYRVLESEGLVEIRGRSGVYVIEQEQLGGGLLSETGRWLAEVMADAWKRQIMIPALPDLIRSCTRAMPLRCAFLESNEDHMLAFIDELEPGFGIDIQPFYLPDEGHSAEVSIARQLGEMDLLITTAFHAAAGRRIADMAKVPLVVVSAHPDLARAIERQLSRAELTVVCTDSRFGERLRRVYAKESPEQVRVVLTGDEAAIAGLDKKEPVLLTRAARRHLGDCDLIPLMPHSPTLSFESARELSEAIIRLNMNHVASREVKEQNSMKNSRARNSSNN